MFSGRLLLVMVMLVLTGISQFAIIPQMDKLRETLGDVASAAASDPLRMQFDALHVWSTRVEGEVLLLGLVLTYLVARQLKHGYCVTGAGAAAGGLSSIEISQVTREQAIACVIVVQVDSRSGHP